jgi:hypothetical protein
MSDFFQVTLPLFIRVSRCCEAWLQTGPVPAEASPASREIPYRCPLGGILHTLAQAKIVPHCMQIIDEGLAIRPSFNQFPLDIPGAPAILACNSRGITI